MSSRLCRGTLIRRYVDGLSIEDIRAERSSTEESPTLSYGAGDSTHNVLEQILQQLNAAVQESIHL